MVQKTHHSVGVVKKMVCLVVVRQVLQIVWASCESNFGYHFGRHLFDVVDGIFRVVVKNQHSVGEYFGSWVFITSRMLHAAKK